MVWEALDENVELNLGWQLAQCCTSSGCFTSIRSQTRSIMDPINKQAWRVQLCVYFVSIAPRVLDLWQNQWSTRTLLDSSCSSLQDGLGGPINGLIDSPSPPPASGSTSTGIRLVDLVWFWWSLLKVSASDHYSSSVSLRMGERERASRWHRQAWWWWLHKTRPGCSART